MGEGLSVECEVLQEGESSATPANTPLAQALSDAVAEVAGSAPTFAMCPGLCEIRFFNRNGVPALAYGPGILSVSHGPDEYVEVERVADCAAIYALTAARLLGGSEPSQAIGDITRLSLRHEDANMRHQLCKVTALLVRHDSEREEKAMPEDSVALPVDLVARARQGEAEAFREDLRALQPAVARVCLAVARQRDLGRRRRAGHVRPEHGGRLSQLQDDERLESWLYRIATRKCFSLLRRRRLLAFLPLDLGSVA